MCSLPYYGKGFTGSAVNTLEKLALDAFDHSLYVDPAQLNEFRSSLAEWSSRVDMLSPFYDTHREMAKNLRELSHSTRNAGSERMQKRQSYRPSAFHISKLHAAVLTGLDDLLKKFPPTPPESPAPLADAAAGCICGLQARRWDAQHNPSSWYFSASESFLEDLDNYFICEDTSIHHKQPSRSHYVRPRPYPSIRQ